MTIKRVVNQVFICNQCGFRSPALPAGWYSLSQATGRVGRRGGPVWHFCSAACLAKWSDVQIGQYQQPDAVPA